MFATVFAPVIFIGLLSSLSNAAIAQDSRSTPAPSAFQIAADGKSVIDTRAKLAWARCAEGMDWNGKACTGSAEVFNYKQAQTHAAERSKAEDQRWRLPRVNELKRLLDRSSKPQGLNPALFPSAPRDWHWTGTASVNAAAVNPYAYGNVARGGAGESNLSVQQGWAVDMTSGEARGDVGRSTRLPIRLVRPAP